MGQELGRLYIRLNIYTIWRIFCPMNIPTSQFFQLLSDDTRLRSLMLMQQGGELCVCELVHALGEIQPKISRHLAALRDAGVVVDRRQEPDVVERPLHQISHPKSVTPHALGVKCGIL